VSIRITRISTRCLRPRRKSAFRTYTYTSSATGRDTAPRSAARYATELRDFLEKLGVGEVATVVGRYYAMDRDKRWERVKIAVEGLVHGKGEAAEEGDYVRAIEARYKKDETDEFLKPIIVNGDAGRIKGARFSPPSY
jgi:2,3-bisphosphoglycerate-independent phosphoglycerate mutase